jgi:[ribosomal protein S18]-alanine N-acetyltransferase
LKLVSRRMARDLAMKILGWKYEPPYDLYNNDGSEESIKELVDQDIFALEDGNNASLIGFYCTGPSAQVPAGRESEVYSDPAIDIGIGMEPSLTGKGLGYDFLSFVMKEIEADRQSHPLRLTVAKFNRRAIKLYGFKYSSEFHAKNNEFISMVKR